MKTISERLSGSPAYLWVAMKKQGGGIRIEHVATHGGASVPFGFAPLCRNVFQKVFKIRVILPDACIRDPGIGLGRSRQSGYKGLLLVIDELGKFLEYAASHPDEGDVFILQALAEAAARSEKPFLILTILHQALDRYTAHI